jgi:hypothetical protein
MRKIKQVLRIIQKGKTFERVKRKLNCRSWWLRWDVKEPN